MSSKQLYLDDAYLKQASAIVTGVEDGSRFTLDQTLFYGASGGQPSDLGYVSTADGKQITLTECKYHGDKSTVWHEFSTDEFNESDLNVGDKIQLNLDWEHRYAHMRMHSALHLLCSLIPFPVTGGSIGQTESRLDFDMPENPDKEALSAALMELVTADHPISSRWITDAELEANADLIRTMSVKPPMGSGRVRLISIGDSDAIDLQPCGGTHVARTSEIGEIHIGKIEKKGRQNRRVRLRFGGFPAS